MKKITEWRILTVVIAIMIFYISSLIRIPGPFVFTMSSIYYHFGIFFIFQWSLIESLGEKIKSEKHLLYVIAFAILYGISDELHQLFVPGRLCTLSDVGINTVGIISATVIYIIYKMCTSYKHISEPGGWD